MKKTAASEKCSVFRKWNLPIALFLIALTSSIAESATIQDVDRIFELNAKIRPGMPVENLNELLGPPLEEYKMTNGASGVTRYSWLHGEMGIEIYVMDSAAYRVNITLPCSNAKDTLRAMDALTRQGNSKYGSMPQFDHTKGEYYWVRDGIRFAFSKYNQTTVLSSCTQTP